MEAVKDPDSRRDQTIERLITQHQTSLLRLCYVQLQDQALAEDAVQETFLKAYRALDAFRGDIQTGITKLGCGILSSCLKLDCGMKTAMWMFTKRRVKKPFLRRKRCVWLKNI